MAETHTPTQSWFHRNPKKTLVTIVLFVSLLADFVLTGVYHYFKYGTIHKYAERRALRERSSVFHHTLKASTQSPSERWGHITHTLTTNSLGFKDKLIRDVPLSSDKYRILFMGDSFTEGVGYEYPQTFVGIVDHELADQNNEVLNAAVGSYSPAVYFKKTEYLLETLGLQFDHLIVFIDISDIEDEATAYDLRDGRLVWIGEYDSIVKDFFYEYSFLPRIILNPLIKLSDKIREDPESLRSEEDKKYGVNRYRALWTVNEEAFADYGERGLKKAKKNMDLLHELIQRHNLTMTIAVYPWPDQVINHDLDSLQVRFWREWANAHSVPFISYFPHFIESGQDPKQVISTYFIEGDSHWNEKGHRLIARRLLAELGQSLSLAPASPRP